MVVIEEVIAHISSFRISKIVGIDKDENDQIAAVKVILLSSKDFDKHDIVLPMKVFEKMDEGKKALETYLKTSKESNDKAAKTNRRKKQSIQQEGDKESEESNANKGILKMLNLSSVTLKKSEKTGDGKDKGKYPEDNTPMRGKEHNPHDCRYGILTKTHRSK